MCVTVYWCWCQFSVQLAGRVVLLVTGSLGCVWLADLERGPNKEELVFGF